jgi:hypothetical protein
MMNIYEVAFADKPQTAPSLLNLASQIKAAHQQVGVALSHALQAGELLLQAKTLVPHGAWLSWLELSCELSERTAQGYMRLARRQVEDPNPQRVADLTIRGALKALSRPITTRKERVRRDAAKRAAATRAAKAAPPADPAVSRGDQIDLEEWLDEIERSAEQRKAEAAAAEPAQPSSWDSALCIAWRAAEHGDREDFVINYRDDLLQLLRMTEPAPATDDFPEMPEFLRRDVAEGAQ